MTLSLAQRQVTAFNKAAMQVCPAKPTIPDAEITDRRIMFIDEELDELADAFLNRDILATADAIGDLLYVVLGAAVDCGIDIEPIFNEIHRSNMSKINGAIFRGDGKILKGPHYTPPALQSIIDLQPAIAIDI